MIQSDYEFAKKWGDLGHVYGKQWRDWGSEKVYGQGESMMYGGIDQIANLIRELKTNPDSRRLMVTAWNPAELDQMTLPPCHYGFQVYTRELSREERYNLMPSITGHTTENIEGRKNINNFDGNDPGVSYHEEWLDSYNIPTRAISLMWNQRSVDTFLGLPFNIASYALLLEIIAKAVNMVPDELIGNLGDTHLYLNHIEQAKEQIGRELSLEERSQLKRGNKEKYPVSKWRDDMGVSKEEYFNEIGIAKRTREPYPLPTLNINTEFWPTESGECGVGPLDSVAVLRGFQDDNFCKCLLEEDLQLSNYQAHPTIKAPLSN